MGTVIPSNEHARWATCCAMLKTPDRRWTIAIQDPLSKPREEFSDLIELLSSADSPVGIDVKYTHAVIIDYLRQIAARLDSIEQTLSERRP